MEIFSFQTIAHPAEGLYKESGSKFISFACPVAGEQAIKENLDFLRKKCFDATHHCYAWMLGPGKERFRANDDGEPAHSAGDPILGQLRSNNLTNVLIVVVRYYGGTKLGVGGLIHAYKTAAESALSQAVIITQEVTREIQIGYSYEDTPEVMKLVKEYELKPGHQQFDEDCIMVAEISLKHWDSFSKKVELLIALRHKISLTLRG